jgi:hypothetical protein
MTIHEPATLLTDYLLTALGGWLAWRLKRSTAIRIPAVRWWYRALLALALSAFVGGSYHGFAPNLPTTAIDLWWRLVLWIICLIGFTMGSALICELAPQATQWIWKRLIIAKFICASAVVFILPDFMVAITDYGSVMFAWFVAAILIHRPWRWPIIAAVALSGLAAWVQQSGIRFSAHINHNDVFHLIQAFALIGFHQAALRMRG